MGRELFLEIGTEEIPAAFMSSALAGMEEIARKSLSEARIAHGDVETFGTPRRLVLVIHDMAERQEDVTVEVQGPAKKVAYDDSGNPTKALLGFARGQGVSVDEVRSVETPKGEYIFVVREEKGVETKGLLPGILSNLVSSIPFRKSMRWGALDVAFARPVHWITAVFGGEVVPFTFGDLRSSNRSRGHRFHSPAEFEVLSFDDYRKKCESARVIIDPAKRRSIIHDGASRSAEEAGGRLIEDEELLAEVSNLVEYPVVLRGSFEKEYLDLPREVVINAMREHQRYFAVENEDKKLLPCFITVSNTEARDMEVVSRGNERVLRARLADAAFYYYEDLKRPLDDMVESLKGVVFQARLGTSYEKVERFKILAAYLAGKLAPESKEKVIRAAHLCKGDLVSGVVGEFPALQGIMGRDYALKAGEDREVAEAIFEHYLPRGADDILPATDTGAIVSMADKMDTICGCFGIGLIPTGTADPYALRRQTIGILNIIRDRGYRLSLSEFVDKGIEVLQDRLSIESAEVKASVLEFFTGRLSGLLSSEGFAHGVVDAVLAVRFDDIVESVEIVKALSHLKDLPDFQPLAIAFKRVANITRGFENGGVDPSMFKEKAEKDLHHAYHTIAGDVFDLARKGRYKDALLKATWIMPYVDTFFDDVMVMVDDLGIRENRLSLLKEVSGLFTRFADFSKIVTER